MVTWTLLFPDTVQDRFSLTNLILSAPKIWSLHGHQRWHCVPVWCSLYSSFCWTGPGPGSPVSPAPPRHTAITYVNIETGSVLQIWFDPELTGMSGYESRTGTGLNIKPGYRIFRIHALPLNFQSDCITRYIITCLLRVVYVQVVDISTGGTESVLNTKPDTGYPVYTLSL